jgi:uncharacterized protein (TIGR00255 family)
MITSMTGYGNGAFANEATEITVEVRSVNNRFLDVSLKMPKSLSIFEQQVREIIGKYASRGRVNVWMSMKNDDEKVNNFVVNNALVDAYINIADQIAKRHGIESKLKIDQIMALPDVITVDSDETADEKTWEAIKSALETALGQLVEMRRREGIEMEKDFVARIDALDSFSDEVESLSKKGPEIELSKLKERVKRFLDKEKVDEYRLELELALISDRIDISEECTRFKSHITLFREMLQDEKAQGRKLNFLLQEMNREANTMASKAYTSEISHAVVNMKEEIEKIREQVQNIE